MSLINQMLKDLEARSNPRSEPNTLLTGLRPPAAKAARNKKRYLIGLALLAFILIWGWNGVHYYRTHHVKMVKQDNTKELATTVPAVPASAPVFTPVSTQTSNNPVAMTPAATSTIPPATLPAASPPAPITEITGLTMETHGKMTFLRVLLNNDVKYQVNSDLIQHSITISMENTRMTVNLPPLDFNSAALSDLKVDADDKNNVKLVLILKPEARLSNLELNKESTNPELQADFLLEINGPENAVEKPRQENPNLEEISKAGIKKIPTDLTVEERYQEALSLIENGDLDKAVEQLTNLVDKYPEYNSARESLINVLLRQDKTNDAERILNIGLQRQPFYPAFVETKAHFLVNEGKVEQALALLKKAPPTMVTNPEYYAFLAALYQQQGNLAAAESLYQQLTMIHPEKGVWWLGLGIAEDGLGKNAQATEAYTKAGNSPDLDPELRGFVESKLRD